MAWIFESIIGAGLLGADRIRALIERFFIEIPPVETPPNEPPRGKGEPKDVYSDPPMRPEGVPRHWVPRRSENGKGWVW